MFGSNKTPQQPQQQPQPAKHRKPQSVKDGAVTILTSGCHFSGKLYCRGSSRIGGKIEGQVISEGLLIVEEQALITADVKADEAVIQGRVKGKLEATARVELTHTSSFEGDIVTPVLVVTEGAQFNGRCQMVHHEAKGQHDNVKKLNGKGDHKTDHHSSKEHHDKTPEIAVMKVPEMTTT